MQKATSLPLDLLTRKLHLLIESISFIFSEKTFFTEEKQLSLSLVMKVEFTYLDNIWQKELIVFTISSFFMYNNFAITNLFY